MKIGGSLRAVWITFFALGLPRVVQGWLLFIIMLMSCLLKVPGPVCAPHEPLWEIGCLVARWEKLSPRRVHRRTVTPAETIGEVRV